MDQNEIMRRYEPKLTSENTGEPDILKIKVSIPDYPQKVLDLHGLNTFEASYEARSFIFRCHDAGLVKIRIITGRGSETGISLLFSEIGKLLSELQQAFLWLKYEKKIGHYDILMLP